MCVLCPFARPFCSVLRPARQLFPPSRACPRLAKVPLMDHRSRVQKKFLLFLNGLSLSLLYLIHRSRKVSLDDDDDGAKTRQRQQEDDVQCY